MFLRAGQHITVTYGDAPQRRLAIVTNPAASAGRIQVRLYSRSTGRWSKTRRYRQASDIVAIGWGRTPKVTP